jgi:hypothetical protein
LSIGTILLVCLIIETGRIAPILIEQRHQCCQLVSTTSACHHHWAITLKINTIGEFECDVAAAASACRTEKNSHPIILLNITIDFYSKENTDVASEQEK